MAYDHCEKIGNQGDVVKHAVLAAVVSEVSKALSEKAVFRYVESHAGYAEYTLPQRKGNKAVGWEKGIGLLGSAFSAQWPTCLVPYRDAAFHQWRERATGSVRADIVQAFDRYPGSSGLVFRLIKKRLNFEFTLHEVNPSAAADLSLYYPFWDKVRIRREDGYNGVLACGNPSFVLIDPPDLDQDSLLAVIESLKKAEVPFMVWTPRIGNSNKPPTEGGEYTAFRQQVAKLQAINPILLRWHDKWRTETCGCCIHLYPERYYQLGLEVADAVREKLNWKEE